MEHPHQVRRHRIRQGMFGQYGFPGPLHCLGRFFNNAHRPGGAGIVLQPPVWQGCPAVAAGILKLDDKVPIPLNPPFQQFPGEFPKILYGAGMNPAVFNKKIGEFSLGWRGYLWRFAVMIQGKDAALQIHFPHSLRGLFKGAAQPLVALQQLRFILLEGGKRRWWLPASRGRDCCTQSGWPESATKTRLCHPERSDGYMASLK